MKNSERHIRLAITVAASLLVATASFAQKKKVSQQQKWEQRDYQTYSVIDNIGGKSIGFSRDSGVKIILTDGYAFKDLNRNGKLDVYEDWRQPYEKRAEDLAKQLSIEEIAGLMLYSKHQSIPATDRTFGVSTYNGIDFKASGAKPWDLSDNQKQFLVEDNLRHVLITTVESPEIAARWNNTIQAFVEGIGHGIPTNNSSDPRHSARADSEFNAGGGGEISMWPGSLGMAATFSPDLMFMHGAIASHEYRMLGFTTALSPQVDIATEPRWMRFSGTFGEDPVLAADMARAYCDGFQSSLIKKGWSEYSVNAMVKHWPGGGSCESGRDAHYGFGKFSVFPNNNLKLHKIPFTEGAFKLTAGTERASAVMPYYTISWNQSNENVANGFNRDMLTRQLRKDHNYEGVICTDWGITGVYTHPGKHDGKPWGVENLSIAERHYKALMAGVDQFGGNNDKQPILDAFEMGVKEHGLKKMTTRMQESAYRLLMNIFRVGLFENPYINPRESSKIVGCADYMASGYQAQQQSVVMLKNHNNVLPMKERLRVFIPKRHEPTYVGFWDNPIAARDVNPLSEEIVDRYFDRVYSEDEADLAIVFINSPNSGYGYDKKNEEYVPISLQYNDYTATTAREVSIAGGDPFETSKNRSYKGKSIKTINRCDMELVQDTRARMGSKPVIVSVNISNPMVMSEIEPFADAIFCTFDIQNQVVLELVRGKIEPSALLPFQMPADMLTVEAQAEDTPRDMKCYKDIDGNTYDFAFGLNWGGVINDSRVQKYKK